MRKRKRFLLRIPIAVAVVFISMVGIFEIQAEAQTGFQLLHSFDTTSPGIDNGFDPVSSLTLSGSTLYGTTKQGGAPASGGTIFKINTDGSGFTLLHSFQGSPSDGDVPQGPLTLSGSTLYGMTEGGGAAYLYGTIFRINTDGSGFTLLHSFTLDSSDGRNPFNSSLTLSGSTLYGMTTLGGLENGGTIFKINTDGSGFTLLHSFGGSPSDGLNPYGSLTLSGSTFYGMTENGGAFGRGTIFKINTDGSGFTLLHSFGGSPSDGSVPRDSLTLSGSKLYGMTPSGGASDNGTIFKINTDGSGFTLLHSFSIVNPDDGSNPSGSLTLLGSKLYGMTPYGGASGNGGTIFRIDSGTFRGLSPILFLLL